MEIPGGSELPPEATIIFHVGGTKFTHDGERERLDVSGLKCHEDGISVTWVECFEGSGGEQFCRAAHAMASGLRVRQSGRIVRTTVGTVQDCLRGEGVRPLVVRDSLPENPGHCLITGIAPTQLGALLVLADAMRDFVPVREIAGLVA